MVQALVVDAHPVVRQAVKEVLKAAFPFIDIKDSSGGDDVVQGICGHAWTFLVLDLHLPGQNGIDIIKRAKACRPVLPIIVFSTYMDRHFAALALRAGANAYISKDRSPRDLLDAVRNVIGGGQADKRTRAFSEPVLSHREVQVLRLFAKGMNRKQIATQLRIKERTVSTYKAKLLHKLDLETFGELIRYAIEEGMAD